MTPAAVLLLTALKFVNPLEHSQVIGPQWVEVTTDAQNVDRVEFTIDGVLAGVARKAPWRITYDFGTSLGTHKISAKAWMNGYRASETATITTAALTAGETLNVDLVEVPMRVHAPAVVKPADVVVKENRVVQEVRDIRPERGPAHFFFVVDRSLSMGDGKLAASLNAIDSELHLLRPDDTASIILFNHNVARPRTIARGEKTAQIFGDVVASGGTSLYDALASIVTSDRTYAIVITDGGDQNSEMSSEEALRRVSNTRTVVEAIILGSKGAFLPQAANNTGGDVVKASRETIDAALRDLIEEINSRYLLIYQSHGTKRGWRTIDIRGRTREVAILKARRGYFAEP
jgi:Bacterial Ig domain